MSLAAAVPDAAQAEGLGGEALSGPSAPPEPAAGTPDGGCEGRGVPGAGPGLGGGLSLRLLGHSASSRLLGTWTYHFVTVPFPLA